MAYVQGVIQGHFPHGLRLGPAIQPFAAMPEWVRARVQQTGGVRPQTQPSAPLQRATAHGNATQLPAAALARIPAVGGEPLPQRVRQTMEAFFGASFADVRLHSGPWVRAIGADAFTVANHLHFAPGAFTPHTPQGQRILAHELTHVVQQRTGRVRNPFGGGVAIVHDRVLEAEAERMSLRASRPPTPSRVAQPLLMFTFPAGTIVNSSYTEEYMEGIGKVAVTYRGVTVYTDPRNLQETRDEIDRRFTHGTLSAIPNETDLTEVDAGVRPLGPHARLFILKTWNPDTIARGQGVYIPGKVFYRVGEGALHHLSESMINRYWDPIYSKFQRITRPDWRYNCGDYALSDDGITSIADEDLHLGQHYTLEFNLKQKNAGDVQAKFESQQGRYVVQASYHYFRLDVGEAQVIVSQKDGDSGVYRATMGVAQAALYCFARNPQILRLYRKK